MTDSSSGAAAGEPPVGRPAPRYGEYAPAGWSAPEPAPAAPPGPGPDAAGVDSNGRPGAGPYAAPGGTPFAPYPYPAYPGRPPGPPPGARRYRTGDVVASVILLVVGAFATLFATFMMVTLPDSMQLLYEQEDLGTYVPDPRIPTATLVIVISHLVLLAAAAVFAILLIRRRRLSFWVPLTAGVIAAIIFWVGFSTVVGSDPRLLQLYG